MSTSLFSSAWYRVAKLRPRLRAHVQIHRHRYRGEIWYLIQDHSSGRFHRFSEETHAVIGLMDGKRSLDKIWESACARLGDDMPSQDEVIALLGQLHHADIVQADIPPDIAEVDRRRSRLERRKLIARLMSPFSIRIPLWDPDRFLKRTDAVAQRVFSRLGAAVWLSVVVAALGLVATNWEALSSNLADRVLAVENLVVLGFVYPVVKGIHEFGHAYAVRRWGGEVHELGIMLLVFMPVPYVEASAATAFSSKYQRMLVAAAGIMTEAFMASLAMFVWTVVEPGTLRVVAFDVMLLAGVSTVLFNGNPLLRFDAYYVLSDILEIPNLGATANRELGYLLRRWVLGVQNEPSPARSNSEAAWLVTYSLAAFSYRMVVMLGIALFLAGKMFIVGVILALWSVYGFLIQPLFKTIRYLLVDPEMKNKRTRLLGVGTAMAALITALLFWVPLPRLTLAEGVLWVPERARVVAGAQGMVAELLVPQGERVELGTPLIRLHNRELDARIAVAQGRLQELAARSEMASAVGEITESRLIEEEILRTTAQAARLGQQQQALLIRSPTGGLFHLSSADDLLGRYLRRGESIGYVLEPGEYRARVLVGQAEVDAVRSDVHDVEVRLAEAFDTILSARISREIPSAHRELPSLALSVEGGGLFALDPQQTQSPRAFEAFFQFEILLSEVPANRIGERVYVRFRHTPEPVGYRFWRAARRVLLERLDS